MADQPETGGTPDDNEERLETVAVTQPRIRPAYSKAEREERERIVAAVGRLAEWLTEDGWSPDIAERTRKVLLEPRISRDWIFRKQYSLPPFREAQQWPWEWKREADEKYRKFRDDELRKCLEANMVDAPVAEPTKRRGTGKIRAEKKRRNNPTEQRYEWAALHWLKYSWKSIAEAYFTCNSPRKWAAAISTVTKAGNAILRSAGLLDEPDRK